MLMKSNIGGNNLTIVDLQWWSDEYGLILLTFYICKYLFYYL